MGKEKQGIVVDLGTEQDKPIKAARAAGVPNVELPTREQEARNHLSIQKESIKQQLNPKLDQTLEEKVRGIEGAAFNLQARDRTLKTLKQEGVSQKELLALKKETDELARKAEKRALEIQKEVKKQPRNDHTNKLEKTMDRAMKTIGKQLGRSR